MADKWIYGAGVIVAVVFLAGVVLGRFLPTLLIIFVPLTCVGILYLGWRFVRAAERIADALERQRLDRGPNEPDRNRS